MADVGGREREKKEVEEGERRRGEEEQQYGFTTAEHTDPRASPLIPSLGRGESVAVVL